MTLSPPRFIYEIKTIAYDAISVNLLPRIFNGIPPQKRGPKHPCHTTYVEKLRLLRTVEHCHINIYFSEATTIASVFDLDMILACIILVIYEHAIQFGSFYKTTFHLEPILVLKPIFLQYFSCWPL